MLISSLFFYYVGFSFCRYIDFLLLNRLFNIYQVIYINCTTKYSITFPALTCGVAAAVSQCIVWPLGEFNLQTSPKRIVLN